MDHSETNMGRPSGVGPVRSNTSTSSRSSTPLNRSIDQSLLQPVVRSRRTPIACTECRRRQVKCSGGTPRCERCEKRDMQCEYIPLHQQKATSSANVVAPIPQSRATWPGVANMSVPSNRSVQPSPAQLHNYQGFVPTASPGQRVDLQNPFVMPSQTPSVRRGYSQSTTHSAPAYGNMGFDQSYLSNIPATPEASLAMHPTYAQSSVVPAQYDYPGVPSYNLYGQAGTSGEMVANNPTYDYRLSDQQRGLSGQMAVPASQSESYQERYYQGSPELYDTSAGNVAPGHPTSSDWRHSALQDPTYPGYQDPSYP